MSNPNVPDTSEERSLPMEVGGGLEALAHVREAIDSFRNYSSKLPLGPRTRVAYDALLKDITNRPDAVRFFAEDSRLLGGRLVHEALSHSEDSGIDHTIEPDSYVLEVIPSKLEGQRTDEILEVASKMGIVIDREMAITLAYAKVVGHELAHGIQHMYSYTMPSERIPLFPTPIYRHLQKDTLEQGIVQPVPVPAAPRLSAIIESERFTEGIAQDFVIQEMVRLGVISPEDTDKIEIARQSLSAQRRDEKFDRTQRIVNEVPPGDHEALHHRLHDENLRIPTFPVALPRGFR